MYWHRLASRFRTPVAALQRQIDADEFAEYVAADRVDVHHDDKVVFLLAQLCSLVYNSWCRGKGRALRPDDFIPKRQMGAKSNAQIKAVFRAYAKAHNAWQAR